MSVWPLSFSRLIALAVLLGGMWLCLGGTAMAHASPEAAGYHHAVQADTAPCHQVQTSGHQAQKPVAPPAAKHAPSGPACHCVSPLCTAAMEPQDMAVLAIPTLRPQFDRPAARQAFALAGVLPPARPPRL